MEYSLLVVCEIDPKNLAMFFFAQFLFLPRSLATRFHFDEHIFQMGAKNHHKVGTVISSGPPHNSIYKGEQKPVIYQFISGHL